MADLHLYDVIEPGFSEELRGTVSKLKSDEPIDLYVNSIGGALNEGVTAYNILTRAPNPVTVHIDGDAFSAATLVVAAGDQVNMAGNALMMVHNPWLPGLAPATIENLQTRLAYLQATKRQAIKIYKQATGLATERIADLMAAETYMSADEALDYGFAHNVTGDVAIQNRPIDDYPVNDRDKLAVALGKRRAILSPEQKQQRFAELLEKINGRR